MREVGPFELLEPLGAGGMGEVFKARDRRLNRFVAIKFLPESAPAAARERFQREAQAIAALNHPHICTLYEVGDDQGRPYLVLELLEGETLRARLRRAGALAPEQLLDWGLQIADALDAAHRKGVLHRDLKPDNIWVGPSGHIKVLDFGLARLETPEDAAAPEDKTLTSPGMTLGTIPYMSPEQARGEALDARSDLFSFGSVFYEMATGRAAFPAPTAAESIAAVLKEQPPAARQVRPEVPPKLEEVVNRCLEKDPDLRYQSAADLRGELKRFKRESGSATAAAPSSASAPAQPPASVPAVAISDSQIISGVLRRHWRWPVVAAAVILGAALAWWRLAPRAPAPPPALQFQQLTFSGHVQDAMISPDGKFLAHVDAGPQGTSLHLLSIGSGSDVEIVPPGGGCCQSPSFSPDGNHVFFLESRVMKSVPVLGGAVHTVGAACSGAGFSPDGSQMAYITAVVPGTMLTLARADGSGAHPLHPSTPGSGNTSQCWGVPGQPGHAPAWSPDGRWIALVESNGSAGHIVVVNATDGHARPLDPNVSFGATDVSWLPDGSGLVFTASIPASAASQVWEVAYPGGKAAQLTNDLQGYASASISARGDLALVHSAPQYSIWAQAHAGGAFQQLPGGGATQDGANGLAWTPQAGLVSFRNLGGKLQLWAENSDGTGAHALAAGDIPDQATVLQVAPNGQIVFDAGSPANLWRVNGDGAGLTPLLHLAANVQALNPALGPGGEQVVYLLMDSQDNQTLWDIPLAGGTPRQLWPHFIFVDGNPVSPDGTRVFAISQGPGSPDAHLPVIIRLDGAKPQVTPLAMDYGTMQPPYAWTPDGRAIAYIYNQGTTDNLWAFPLNGGKPYALTHFTDLRIAAYAFAPDGRLAVSRGTPNSDAAVATGLGTVH